MVHATAGDDRATVAVPVDFDGSGQIWISFKKAQALQGIEMIVHRGWRCEANGVADFAH